MTRIIAANFEYKTCHACHPMPAQPLLQLRHSIVFNKLEKSSINGWLYWELSHRKALEGIRISVDLFDHLNRVVIWRRFVDRWVSVGKQESALGWVWLSLTPIHVISITCNWNQCFGVQVCLNSQLFSDFRIPIQCNCSSRSDLEFVSNPKCS